ncbi:DMSO reductase anchor subunit [Hasllibacter halocynthiae]|uniref:DMSO reductase anchor subunit n=1 Tax=Hasllibacter halocynthiae TaxID=595589 RepID=A0A2T0X6Q3_9RHOB|nr:DmsC/YnfH family molybdoenzyme membrane anchor subunit [Hasllibacter halocynthiae]PRY94603.1 DMSO reductase anchor subunit [Hasllibacter halocynthiae]
MHPAPSIILFSTLSGLGFGLLVFLGVGAIQPVGPAAAAFHGIGLGLAVAGLVSSTFHLGRPERAWRSFTQWRTSWLSREAWAAVGALLAASLFALTAVLGAPVPLLGLLSAALCLLTVLCTAMIYASIRAVPRWHHWTTPATFLLWCLGGGAILAAQTWLAAMILLAAGVLQVATWRRGDDAFAALGQTVGTATGLGARVEPLERPHTGESYLTHEMVFRVGRRHADRLRLIALLLAVVAPTFLLLLVPSHAAGLVALLCFAAGILAQRWLFFAEAEHTVGLYYGAPGGRTT